MPKNCAAFHKGRRRSADLKIFHNALRTWEKELSTGWLLCSSDIDLMQVTNALWELSHFFLRTICTHAFFILSWEKIESKCNLSPTELKLSIPKIRRSKVPKDIKLVRALKLRKVQSGSTLSVSVIKQNNILSTSMHDGNNYACKFATLIVIASRTKIKELFSHSKRSSNQI